MKRIFRQKLLLFGGALLALLLVQHAASGQTRFFNGKVTDEKGAELPGVSVINQRTSQGATTDENGRYRMEAMPEKDVLVFRMLGFQTMKVVPEGTGALNVTLQRSSSSLDELVVVGYGKQKKIDLTGAVAQVDGEVLTNRPVTNIGQALQGVVANLNITTTGDPGGPGTPAFFSIRGTNSLNGGGPFYVVDGVPADNIDNINPVDIESVTVLKDAAASAIYGARAPYGVILIVTKKGKKGKLTVNYSNMFAMSTYTKLPRMANSVEFAETYNQAALNSGEVPPFSDAFIDKLKQYMADPEHVPVTGPSPTDPNVWDFGNANANVDWFKAYVKPWSFNQKHDLSVSGGGENTTYYLSAGYFGQGGQLRYGDDRFDRYNLTSNIHSEPVRWLRFDLRTRFSKGTKDYPFPYSDLQGNWFHLAGTRRPYWPVRNPDGELSHISAITYFTSGARSINVNNDLWLTGAVEIEPLKNWKINLDYSWNNRNVKRTDQDAFVYATAIDGTKYSIGHGQNAISESVDMNGYNSFNAYSSYERELGKHYVKVLVGQQIEVSKFFTLSGRRTDLITDQIPSMGVATGTQYASDAISHWATTGTFARLNYNYVEKYLLEFNGRYDGTSKFPENKRFGFFPSVSAGYNIARENFWPLKKYVDEFKFRASYGSLGNQAVQNYAYLSTIPVYSNLGYIINNVRPNYLLAPGLVSADLTWETVQTLDMGVDAALFQNRLNASFDWYQRTTLDMLGPAEALPVTLGTAVPVKNNADMRTRGFELNLNWKDRIGKDFSYNISFVLSNYKTKVTRYNNPTGILSTYYEGETIGDIWGYETAGLIQDDKQVASMPDQSLFYGQWGKGDVLYTDRNGDDKIDYGKYTLEDHGDLTVIGNSDPRFSFGWNAGFSWKGFDFNMFWQGIAKRDLWLNGTLFYGLLGGYGSAVWKNTLDYWTPENTDAYWPKPYSTSEINKNRQVQTRYLQSGAYMRLKNLQIGYNIPARWLQRIKIQKVRLFVSGENLLTFTKMNENFDPEVTSGSWGSGKIYPLLKTFSFGMNIGF